MFVDINKKSVDCIKKNISNARFSDVSTVYNADALDFLNKTREKFDLIFLDPPYMGGLYENVFKLIEKNNLLNDDGIILVEMDYENRITNNLFGFELIKEKKYGKVCVLVLKRRQV